MNIVTARHFFKYLTMLFFAFLIVVKGYLTISQHVPLYKLSVLLLLTFIGILLNKNKVSWSLGIALFAYGIYNVVFISIKTSEPTTMEFTSSLNYLLYGTHTGFFMQGIIGSIPFYFYLIALIFFFTKPVRRIYHVSA